MNASEEVYGGLVVAGRNRAVLLELAIEVLHEVASFVHFLVVEALNLSITLGRNDELFSGRKQRRDDALIGIESLVCQQGVGLHLGQKRVAIFQVMGLPCRSQLPKILAKFSLPLTRGFIVFVSITSAKIYLSSTPTPYETNHRSMLDSSFP